MGGRHRVSDGTSPIRALVGGGTMDPAHAPFLKETVSIISTQHENATNATASAQTGAPGSLWLSGPVACNLVEPFARQNK